MPRLSDRAFQILVAEIQRCTGNDLAGKVQRDIVLKRLEKLRFQKGTPVSPEELRGVVVDMFPSFNEADQLINQASGPGDLTLGEVKLEEAAKNLDALPVWFLGYSPQYTFWYGWQFTLDEFRTARANVGRMEATLFQEKQAQIQLTQAEQAIKVAKQQYQQAKTVAERTPEIAAWQAALDILQQIPPETLAGRVAQTKLVAFTRDYEKGASLAIGSARSGTLIEAAQEFAKAGTQVSLKPPNTAASWNQAASLWQKAIERLEAIPVEDPGYASAQKLLATYQTNLGTVQTHLQAEQAAVEVLQQAQTSSQDLVASGSSMDRNQIIAQLQGIMDQLETIPPGTTAYSEAQNLMGSAQEKLQQL